MPLVAWRGSALGVDPKSTSWTPLTEEIIKRNGAVDEESLKAYGKIAGTIGGTALCAATGIGAAVAVGCGIVGGIVGEYIASKIPLAKGTDMDALVKETWSEIVKPRAKDAARGIFSVKAYLVMRDEAKRRGFTEQELLDLNLPPAPVDPRWKPSQKRWQKAQELYAKSALQTKDGLIPKEIAVAKDLGIITDKFTPQDYVFTVYHEGYYGPVAPPTEPIDWFAVGRDEFTVAHKSKENCSGWNVKYDPGMPCPAVAPSKLAAVRLAKLRGVLGLKTGAPPPSEPGAGTSVALPLAIGAGIVGLIIWALI